jgi:hypothetical protein
VQNEPVPQAQPSLCCNTVCGRAWLWPPYTAEQLFFEPLIDPSLHRNRSPSHRSIPPFFPEHGVLPAQLEALAMHSNNNVTGIPPRRIKVSTAQFPE